MQVLVLGPLEVIDDNGVAVTLSGARIRALTALLALEVGHVVSTDRLIDAIYGEQLPQSAANALQLQVSRLRQALKSPTAIVTRPPGYLFDLAPDDVDAIRFERLVAGGRAALEAGTTADGSRLLHQALALWRGDALADFAFDDFATGPRARLHELRLSAAEDCIEADLDLGRHVECAEQLERLVANHPLRERLWGLLMIALYRGGRQAEALRAFQDARRHLGDELGIDPGPELRRLETAVLCQDESIARPARPVAAAGPLPAGNLARPLTPCIGRDAELVAVHRLLESHRLVTLIGPGGTGKTRLAVEVGLTSDATAWMVDLGSVSEGQGVMPAVRTALGLQAPSMGSLADAPSTAGLAAAFGDREVVIVLDNCEHVIAAAAFAAAELVAACPRLRILATSRESLGVPGEVLYAVPPLGQDAAVVLFAERAAASAPGIAFDSAATAAVADICRRLDGLPLAIELAAARVRALDVTQIAIRLNDRFRLLTTGPRTLLPRQRTLRAVVDWSYDLLEGGERSLFERLSVFARAASLDAVEAVCAGDGPDAGSLDPDDVAQLLSRLVDKSLVVVVRTPAGNRYSMLQTLSEYAADKLGVGDVVHQRHADWVLALVRGAERGAGTRPTVSLAELEAEVDNVDSALAWARTHNPALALELAGRLGWFWFWTGRIDLGWQALSAGLTADGVSCTLRTRAAAWGGMLGTVMQADGAADLVESAVEIGRSCGHPASLGQALAIRATLTILRGEPGRAATDLAEAGACYSAAADLHGQGIVNMVQGMAAMAEGRYADAETNYQRSLSFLDANGDEWAAGVSVQRLAELAERRARSLDLDGTPPSPGLPSSFSQALIRAQVAATRRRVGAATSPTSAGAAASTDALALAVADHIRGRVTLRQNRPLEARSDLELALGRYRAQGHTAAVSSCLADLGRIATAIGDTSGAVRFHAEATSVAITTSDGTVVLSALEALSAALLATGDGQRAGLALGVADVLREHGTRPWDATRDDRAPTESAAAALLGDAGLDQVRATGRTMRIEDLLVDLVPA